jgi:hypothetical protein
VYDLWPLIPLALGMVAFLVTFWLRPQDRPVDAGWLLAFVGAVVLIVVGIGGIVLTYWKR